MAKNGDVCISILHEPGEDKFGYEKPEERWLPIHTVETIMISVISMLADPNSDSPANVDAAVSLDPDTDSSCCDVDAENTWMMSKVVCVHRKNGERIQLVSSKGK